MAPLDRDAVSALNASAPEWLADLRERAFDYFTKLEMPSQTEEVWRYVDLDFDLADFDLAEEPGDPLPDSDPMTRQLEAVAKALVVDGHTVSVEAASVDGLVFEGFPKAATDDTDLGRLLGDGIALDLDLFSAAHHAFLADGVHVGVAAGTVIEGPIVIELQATSPERLSNPHVTIAVGENAEASVVLSCRSPDQARFLVVPQIEVMVGKAARCRVTTVQAWGADTRAMAYQRARLATDASALLAEVGLGGKLSRLHLTVDLEGRGASSRVLGVYFGERQQVLDYRAFINHFGRSTTSDMFLKGAVEDEASSVFTGLIKIWEEADGTRAFQTNRNLVLSDGAKAQSVPNLEILCDDVMCGHGSTSGPLEEEHLYYLMSRGLTKPRAERLLVRGFFDEIIGRLPEPGLVEPIRAEINRKFVAAQVEGRI